MCSVREDPIGCAILSTNPGYQTKGYSRFPWGLPGDVDGISQEESAVDRPATLAERVLGGQMALQQD
jgi:hypothetical protein